MEYQHTAEDQAAKQSVKLYRTIQLPNDPHLQVVLCECGGFQPFVVWFFNRECGGFHEGIYCKTLIDAVDAFCTRCRRYGAVP